MNEPMPPHDVARYSAWAYKRRESLASKRSRVTSALTFAPKTSTDIGMEIGMPACVVGGILARLKFDGRVRSTGWQKLPDGRRVLGWVTADAPTVADLVSLHAGRSLWIMPGQIIWHNR